MLASSNNNDRKTFVTPKAQDIMCGRGMVKFLHPGNQLLRTKIVRSLKEWNSVGKKNRKAKSLIIRNVAESILQDGGRFLKFDKIVGQWYDGGMAAAKYRVGIAFRDASAKKVKCIEAMKESLRLEEKHCEGSTSSCYPGNSVAIPLVDKDVRSVCPDENQSSNITVSSTSSKKHLSIFRPIAKFDASLDKLDLMTILRDAAINDERLDRELTLSIVVDQSDDDDLDVARELLHLVNDIEPDNTRSTANDDNDEIATFFSDLLLERHDSSLFYGVTGATSV